MSCVYLIHEAYPTLTKSEKKIADLLLEQGSETMNMTMSDIKEKTQVGDATIIRFCQKLGLSGFSDLKIEFAKEHFGKVQQEKLTQTIYETVAQGISDAIDATIELIDEEALKRAVDALSRAQRVYIFGVGMSANSALDLEFMFLRVGVTSHTIVDPHVQAQVASLLGPQDCVIAFSLSGRTKDTHCAFELAHQNGAFAIAITNFKNSPIAKVSDVVLQTSVNEFLDGGSLPGKISQLYISSLIVSEYERSNHIDPVSLRERVLRSILDKRID